MLVGQLREGVDGAAERRHLGGREVAEELGRRPGKDLRRRSERAAAEEQPRFECGIRHDLSLDCAPAKVCGAGARVVVVVAVACASARV